MRRNSAGSGRSGRNRESDSRLGSTSRCVAGPTPVAIELSAATVMLGRTVLATGLPCRLANAVRFGISFPGDRVGPQPVDHQQDSAGTVSHVELLLLAISRLNSGD